MDPVTVRWALVDENGREMARDLRACLIACSEGRNDLTLHLFINGRAYGCWQPPQALAVLRSISSMLDSYDSAWPAVVEARASLAATVDEPDEDTWVYRRVIDPDGVERNERVLPNRRRP